MPSIVPPPRRQPTKPAKLSERIINDIPPAEKWHPNDLKQGYLFTWDAACPGFGLRTTKAAVQSFVLRYRSEGRVRTHTIGRYPSLTATAARKIATELKARIARGSDPLDERQAIGGELTFAGLVDAFAERHLAQRKSGAETERLLRVDAVPKLGRLRVSEIRKRSIAELVEHKAQGGAPVAANRLLSAVSRCFNWGNRVDLIECGNPAQHIPKIPEKGRDRVLSDAEIVVFWRGLDTLPRASQDIRDALRLILLTACRSGEIVSMRWNEIVDGWYELPASRSKNGRAHRAPLSELAVEILNGRERSSEWVFPSTQAEHLAKHSLATAVLRGREHFDIPPWSPHDLRRTTATGLGKLRIEPHIIERVLNHSPQGVTSRVYNLHAYDDEKRAALEAWERKLRGLLFGEKSAVLEFSR